MEIESGKMPTWQWLFVGLVVSFLLGIAMSVLLPYDTDTITAPLKTELVESRATLEKILITGQTSLEMKDATIQQLEQTIEELKQIESY